MKTLIASTLVALGLLASAAGAAPYDVTSRSDVPQWAQKAFAGSGH
jgi:putative salt-induced outer membrane protein YdiY